MTLAIRLRLGVLVAGLWWGSLTGLGFVVVPLLFAHLGSPAAAGAMAATLFTAQTWLSIACTMLLLIIFNPKQGVAVVFTSSSAIKSVVLGLLLTVLVEFAVSPNIAAARAASGDLRLWHGLGSAMYLGQWVCAALTAWCIAGATLALPTAGD